MDGNTGRYLIFFGLLVLAAGVIIYFFHDRLHWIGRLPGDIRIEKGNIRFYFPVTTLILFSLVLSLLFNLLKKFL